jgi:HAD superfamily hydrolase (TIGR01509 family)
MELIASGALPLRPGVARLVDEAIDQGIKLAVCSTSNERAVNTIVDVLLGKERKNAFSAILAGDVVSRKKPDPEIYLLCQQRLKVIPAKCVVVEDNRNGLMAAKSAGMICLVTTNPYTVSEDFTGADMVVDQLGDGDEIKVSIHDLMNLTA